MGLESYLFTIEFKDPVPEQDIVALFESIGMAHLVEKHEKRTDENYGSYYFELRTENGLTEGHCILPPTDQTLSDFSLRFSVVSPQSVIDQTFALLKRLNDARKIQVQDTEIRNHIYRQLRKDKKVNDWFQGLEGTEEEETIDNLTYIEINTEKFRENKHGVTKRQIILNNDNGAVIEGGATTLDYIEQKGLFDRFIGWIKNEL